MFQLLQSKVMLFPVVKASAAESHLTDRFLILAEKVLQFNTFSRNQRLISVYAAPETEADFG